MQVPHAVRNTAKEQFMTTEIMPMEPNLEVDWLMGKLTGYRKDDLKKITQLKEEPPDDREPGKDNT